MKRSITLLLTLATGFAAFAGPAQKRVELENSIRDRVQAIVSKADPLAIVQVQINLKKIATNLPVFGYETEVTPLEFDGELGSSSIHNIDVRVITQKDQLPEWMKKEIDKTFGNSEIKMNVVYEKAGGELADPSGDLARYTRENGESAVKGLQAVRIGVWAIFGGLIFCLSVVAFAIFGFARRLEAAMIKVIEEKVVPAMQQAGGRGTAQISERGVKEDDGQPKVMQISGGMGGGKEMSDVPDQALLSLLNDCYWTEADGYAHYIWTQMTQEQREKVLTSGQIDPQYFSHVRQVSPVNLNYHTDARYLMFGRDFQAMNQADLSEWLKKNPNLFYRVTPLRWDLLPLSLEDRIRFNEMKVEQKESSEPLKLAVKSKPRLLQSKLHVRVLRGEDEEFLWRNSDRVPEHVRGSLRSLVWLALAPVEYREKILSEIDARQLAEAWIGPEPVLAALKEVLSPKKAEMLAHFLSSSAPDRDNATFGYLFEAGLQAPKTGAEAQAA